MIFLNGRGKPRRWTRQATSVQGALGIGAASFWSAAEKDIAESPTAIAGTPRKKVNGQWILF